MSSKQPAKAWYCVAVRISQPIVYTILGRSVFAKFIGADIARYAKVIRETGAKVD